MDDLQINLAAGVDDDTRTYGTATYILGNDTFTSRIYDIEVVKGTAASDGLDGDSLGNTLIGSGGDDTFAPSGGNDSIQGDEGRDALSYKFASGGGITIDLRETDYQNIGADQGYDKFSSIENVTGSG